MSRSPNNSIALSGQQQVLSIFNQSKSFVGRNANSTPSGFRVLLSVPEAGRRQAMLSEEVRDSTKALAHRIRPDNLHASFIHRMHIDWHTGLRMQFAGKPDMIRVVVSEHQSLQLIEAQASLLQTC